MGEKYKELVGAIAEYRGSHLRFSEGVEDHTLKLNDILNTNPKADVALFKVRALVKELHKVTIPYSSAIDKLDKITSSVDAPRFRYDFSNFKLPTYPSGRYSLGNSQENRQKEYRLWKQDRVLEYLIAQEQDYLGKYGQLFQREGKVTETSTYQWEIDRNTRKITLSTPEGARDYSPKKRGLFSIFKKLWDNEGTPVSLKELCRVTKQERGYARDYVIDLKNGLTKQLDIPRDVVEKIITRYPLTGKIKTYTFHKNPL